MDNKICEVCGQIDAQEEKITDSLEESFHLHVCETCIGDLRWQD